MSQNIDARARRQASLSYDLVKDLMIRVTALEGILEAVYGPLQGSVSTTEEE